MFAEYASRCVGEGGMHDTAMLWAPSAGTDTREGRHRLAVLPELGHGPGERGVPHRIMPHFILEYSRTSSRSSTWTALPAAALSRPRDRIFPLENPLPRPSCETYLVADGNPRNGFVHLTLKLGHGHSLDVKKSCGARSSSPHSPSS
jgi:hypothetical protein